ncbi:WD40-repeat-containing domain protein [Pavlovales sp. CCMP2436]|nr:WD40-repeat-containing domain protein [Pavlovales sp. CCMP2436]
MQLRHLKTIHPPQEGIAKVTAICWSPNNRRVAVVTTDRVVHLFDENGDRRDKFSTKPADAARVKNYMVRGMAWSPDSSKLAVAQSDNIVFVYKLGTEWGDRKSICNKFHQQVRIACTGGHSARQAAIASQTSQPSQPAERAGSGLSSITCVCWPSEHPHEVVFGLAEGKVKIGQLRSNKPLTLYSTDSYVVSCCARMDGNAVLSGHLDGSVYRFVFDESGRGALQTQVCQHTCVPYALAWGEAICAAGNDQKIVFYDNNGVVLQGWNWRKVVQNVDKLYTARSLRVFYGRLCIIANPNRLSPRSNPAQPCTNQAGVKNVDNLYTVTALGWKADGSRLCVGSLCGEYLLFKYIFSRLVADPPPPAISVEMYDACIHRYRYRGKFEFTYVSAPRDWCAHRPQIALRIRGAFLVTKINIYEDRFLIAHTPETLLMGDLDTCKLSEVPWQTTSKEKFLFDNERVCVICTQAELTLVEYGRNEVLGSCRTEYMNPHQLSVKVKTLPLNRVAEAAALAQLITHSDGTSF